MPNDIFSDNPLSNESDINLDEINLEVLVGEDKKYKTPDELAKAYAHAEAFIAKTKAERVQLEAENKVLKELDETRRKDLTPPAPKQDDPPVVPENKNEEKDLSTLIKEQLDEADKQKSYASNVDQVAEKLANYYGTAQKAQEALAKKAKELNVSVKWLMDIAGTTPAAFYGVVGLDQKSFSTPASEGDLNTSALANRTGKKNFNYYEEIRKTDGKRYWTADVQREMYAAARDMGAAFYT